MKPYRLSDGTAIAIGGAVTATAVIWLAETTATPLQALLAICPGFALTLMLLLGSNSTLERLKEWIQKKPVRIVSIPAGLWLLYQVYAIGMGFAMPGLATVMAVYLSVPFIVLAAFRRAEPLVILWLWLPLELGIIRRTMIAPLPGADLHYAFAQFLAIDAGVAAFVVWNRTPDTGYRFEWDWKIIRAGLENFLFFAAIAVPLGFTIHFIHYAFALRKLYASVPVFSGIFLFTAWPEEFLFRGLIQNWIERMTAKPHVSLVLASVIFGASHLNNGPPLPNYRYFFMAIIAGIFYGRAWQSTRSLMASSLTHALVDTIWSVVFR